MIEAGRLYKLKNKHVNFQYYCISYVMVIEIVNNTIIYRSIEDFDMQYKAQPCDFMELYDLWDGSF